MTRLIAACCGLLLSGCTLSHSEAEHALTSALQSTVEDAPTVRHGVLRVQTADREIDACWAIGDAMPGRPITADTPFLSASIGKLVVAATVFDLAADGLLSLDDPLSRWLDPTLLAGLPVQGGDPAVLQITVGQLLQHRSGLPDYFDGTTVPPHDGAPDVLGLLASEPERTWTPLALLDYTRTHFPPAGAPGERFAYSDLNYDLVGMVIASATGAPWHEAVRSRVLDPLGMLHTWVHLHESPPPGIPELAGAWLGDLEIGRSPGLSLDGAGGGLATTTGDLVTLIRGLEVGQPVALSVLASDTTPDALHRGIDYGYGAWHVKPGRMLFLMAGLPELRGVSGATGSFVYLTPQGTVVAGTFDQIDMAEGHVEFLLRHVLPTLSRVR